MAAATSLFTNGQDTICPAGDPTCFTIISWSVDRLSVAIPGSVVDTEVTGDGAAGDIFQYEISGTGVIVTPPSLLLNAPTLDLTIVPESNVDGIANGRDAKTGFELRKERIHICGVTLDVAHLQVFGGGARLVRVELAKMKLPIADVDPPQMFATRMPRRNRPTIGKVKQMK